MYGVFSLFSSFFQAQFMFRRHCVSTPINGSRLLQSGDNKIFQLCTKHQGIFFPSHPSPHSENISTTVPIVVVFTKFDGLVTSKEKDLFEQNLGLNKETLIERAKEIAAASFEKDCDALIERAKANGVPYIFVSSESSTFCTEPILTLFIAS